MQVFSVRGILYILLATAFIGCSNYQKIVKEGTPIEKLEAAKKYYQNKDYMRALPLLEELMGLYYGKKEREEIYYLYAYSHYGDEQFLLAGYLFNNFAQTYTNSPKREEASFMSALCKFERAMPFELDQTPTQEAINELQSFINQYPNSSYVADCNQKIDLLRERLLYKVYESAILYHSLGYYKSAMVSCQNALEDYPDMINREELSYLVAESAYLYAKNSVTKKQLERYRETLEKVNAFNKEYKNSEMYKKRIEKIQKASETEITLLSNH